ncbi:MAG: hypothetical protein FJ297_02820 [Planctomycetes bacterium]|nr:hypothetical protein [Planctomycetota bacterium]
MAVDTPATIAILGAGPIGVEAALYGRFLGYDVRVWERGRIAENVLRWGHARMYTPFACVHSPLGRAALVAQDAAYRGPADDAFVTGREWVDRYVGPLAATDLLTDSIRERTDVLRVTRWSGSKGGCEHGDGDRDEMPFRILARGPRGEEIVETADIVIDATGVYQNANWVGPGGGPAVGETALRSEIEYGLPDAAGRERDRYAGRRVLLVGSGHSAAATAIALAALRRDHPETRVTWVTRDRADRDGGPVPRLVGDRLPARDAVAREANELARASRTPSASNGFEHLPGWRVDSIARDADAFRTRLAPDSQSPTNGPVRDAVFDRIIGNVGYRPDHGPESELRVHLCPTTEGPFELAAALGEGPHARGNAAYRPADAGEEPDAPGDRSEADGESTAPSARVLVTAEPNYYVLGAKSYGRRSDFLFLTGLHQIRDLFTIIGDRAGLNLYATAARLPH